MNIKSLKPEHIVIIMDGGGAQEFCFYQEMESIYLMNKQKKDLEQFTPFKQV